MWIWRTIPLSWYLVMGYDYMAAYSKIWTKNLAIYLVSFTCYAIMMFNTTNVVGYTVCAYQRNLPATFWTMLASGGGGGGYPYLLFSIISASELYLRDFNNGRRMWLVCSDVLELL